MTQLHCYLPDEVAASLRRRADQAGMSVSRYLAELARRDIGQSWPEGYFEQVFGHEEIDPITRPAQGTFEPRPSHRPRRAGTLSAEWKLRGSRT